MTKKRTEVNKKIGEITDKIVREFNPEKIILFGSYAWGKPGPDSDIDLFVVKKTNNARRMSREIDGTIVPRSFAIDFLVTTPARIKQREKMGDFFIKKILNSGVLLYEKK